MKTSNSLLLLSFILLAFSPMEAISRPSEKKSVKCRKIQPTGNYVIDLIALGALKNDSTVGFGSNPSMIDLMRDSYNASYSFQMVDSSSVDSNTVGQSFNKIKESALLLNGNETNVLPYNIQEKLRFSAILCIILFVFILIVGYTSPLFRKNYGAAISELSPFSLSRCILFGWIFGLLGSSLAIFGSTCTLPHCVISIPFFGGAIFITFLFSLMVDKIGGSNEKYAEARMKSSGFWNDLIINKGNLCIPRFQYFLISTLNLVLIVFPAWQRLLFSDLQGVFFVVQTLSSMFYIGHKAAHLQPFHSLIFRKSMRL